MGIVGKVHRGPFCLLLSLYCLPYEINLLWQRSMVDAVEGDMETIRIVLNLKEFAV